VGFYTSNLGNALASDVLSGIWVQSLADRNALPNHPSLIRAPAPVGATTVRVPDLDLNGAVLLASTTEGAAVSATTPTDNASDIALARFSKRYDLSDFMRQVDGLGISAEQVFAMDALIACGATLRDEVAQIVDDFSSTVGSTTVDATAANFLEAIATLEIASVNGPYLAMLHPRQWADIRSDVSTASGGAIQWNAGSQEVLNASKGLGSQGNFLGVDVYTTTSIVTSNAGADRAGGMFGRGAIAYAMSAPRSDADFTQVVLGNEVLFEKDRNAPAGLTEYVSHMHFGVVEVLDAAGVSIITDA
jgi:hypothetical protein